MKFSVMLQNMEIVDVITS